MWNFWLVSAQGFEPRTHALEGRCSIQLSYAPIFLMERVKGIEPSQPAWKAGTLPLSYTRMVTHRGIEPLLPPWKGGVLTAWPMSHIILF